MAQPGPDDLLTLSELAQAIRNHRRSTLNRHATTFWRRATKGVRAKDGSIHFLQTARDGETILCTLRWWREHVAAVGAADRQFYEQHSQQNGDTRGPRRAHTQRRTSAALANQSAESAGW